MVSSYKSYQLSRIMILMASSPLNGLSSKKKKSRNGSLSSSLRRNQSKKIQNKTQMWQLETLSQYLKTRLLEQLSQNTE